MKKIALFLVLILLSFAPSFAGNVDLAQAQHVAESLLRSKTGQTPDIHLIDYAEAFERVCFAHEDQILQALGVSGISTTFYSWRITPNETAKTGAQVDLIIDRADGIIDLCEIKFTKEPFTVTAEDETNLETKIARLSEETCTDKAIHLVLISAKGLKTNDNFSIF